MPNHKSLIPTDRIEKAILVIRGHRVLLDRDLAELYGVQTKVLNQAVKRNIDRFPEDFMFQLSQEEVEELNRSQIVTGSQKHRDPRFRPYAFTEHGAVMLANVLKSKTAVQASIQVVRAFVRMRQMLASNRGLMEKILDMEKRYDAQFKSVFDAIRYLMAGEEQKPKRQIGLKTDKDDK